MLFLMQLRLIQYKLKKKKKTDTMYKRYKNSQQIVMHKDENYYILLTNILFGGC